MKKYYWYSPREGYFLTDTPFVEQEEGLKSVTVTEYGLAKIAEVRKKRN